MSIPHTGGGDVESETINREYEIMSNNTKTWHWLGLALAVALLTPALAWGQFATDLECEVPGCVGTRDIADGAVTGNKLANGSILTGKFANGSVTGNKIAQGAVLAGKLANGAVRTGKIADGAVTAGKLAQVVADVVFAPRDLEIVEVRVDCTLGETIQAAVDAALVGQTTLIILENPCTEDVFIRKDDIILDGDPSDPGQQGGTTSTLTGTITIIESHRVILQNLTVTGAGRGVVGSRGAVFRVVNSIIDSNGSEGIAIFDGSYARIEDSSITRNGTVPNAENNNRRGILANRGAVFRVRSSVIRLNAGDGVGLFEGCFGQIEDSSITENSERGLHAGFGSTMRARNNTISDNVGDGVGVFNGSSARLDMNQIQDNAEIGVNVARARVRARENTITGNGGFAAISVYNSASYRSGFFPGETIGFETITAGPSGNAIDTGRQSLVELRETNVTGDMFVFDLTQLEMRSTATPKSIVTGNIECANFAIVRLRDSVIYSGTAINLGDCRISLP